MRKRFVYPSIIFTGALIIAAQVMRSQAATPQQWEYASVTAAGEYGESNARSGPMKWFGEAVTCTATTDGCQGQKITVEGNVHNAMMKAAAIFGEQGWELVNVTRVEPASGKDTGSMFFRRLKSAPR